MKLLPRTRQAQRGSLLIVAMLLAAIIGISIVSYLNLARTGMEISNRALYNSAAMNIAENGLEHAVYALNKTVADGSYDWTANGWSLVDTSNARQKWTSYTFDQGATGTVRAYVYNRSGPSPQVVTRSTVQLGGSSSKVIEKWVMVQMRKTSKFANGLVAKESISFAGNTASVDSWNSEKNNDGTLRGSPAPYSAGVKKDNGSVGSISVSVSAVEVKNADIWGYAATGGSLPVVGPNGRIGAFGSTAGTMDMNRVSTDFAASFDAVTAPTATYNTIASAITNDLTLPRPGVDTRAADGYYYIQVDSINFNGNNKVLTISDKVILKLTNALTAIDITGAPNNGIAVNTGAELQIYTAGDIKIAGNGILNGGNTLATAQQPSKIQIYGTKTSGVQDIQIAGNGVLSAVLYAPQGSVKINGNGDVCGSVVANNIQVTGNAMFHYDEALADFGGTNPYRVSRWKELTTETDRNVYAGVLSW